MASVILQDVHELLAVPWWGSQELLYAKKLPLKWHVQVANLRQDAMECIITMDLPVFSRLEPSSSLSGREGSFRASWGWPPTVQSSLPIHNHFSCSHASQYSGVAVNACMRSVHQHVDPPLTTSTNCMVTELHEHEFLMTQIVRALNQLTALLPTQVMWSQTPHLHGDQSNVPLDLVCWHKNHPAFWVMMGLAAISSCTAPANKATFMNNERPMMQSAHNSFSMHYPMDFMQLLRNSVWIRVQDLNLCWLKWKPKKWTGELVKTCIASSADLTHQFTCAGAIHWGICYCYTIKNNIQDVTST